MSHSLSPWSESHIKDMQPRPAWAGTVSPWHGVLYYDCLSTGSMTGLVTRAIISMQEENIHCEYNIIMCALT